MRGKRRPAWYRQGLRFSCQRSGNCCTGPSGRVWFNPDELARMARRLGLLPFEFLDRFAQKLDGRDSLREVEVEPGKFDCVFLTRDEHARGGCQVYDDRPAQCRTWPFWPENLESRSAWRRAGRGCPGMDQGELFSEGAIDARRDDTPLD